MQHVRCAGGIVRNLEHGILVVTNKIGRRTLPKGTCEPGETDEMTAWREVYEESGLTHLTLIRKLGVLSRQGFTANNTEIPSVIKDITMFLWITRQVELCPVAADITAAHWLAYDELIHTLSWSEEQAFVAEHWPLLDT